MLVKNILEIGEKPTDEENWFHVYVNASEAI